ncbi:hypothetical protein, partial [Aquidulcibacter sp.]|uniref:hypothetical protein n=1 Tax=Aquidulcibacter sp. TaxID=2052990 RepID=UPI003BA430D3
GQGRNAIGRPEIETKGGCVGHGGGGLNGLVGCCLGAIHLTLSSPPKRERTAGTPSDFAAQGMGLG